jgi:hypothetical protein
VSPPPWRFAAPQTCPDDFILSFDKNRCAIGEISDKTDRIQDRKRPAHRNVSELASAETRASLYHTPSPVATAA